MKFKIEDLLGMKAALERLVQIKLPVKVAYRTAKNTRLIMQELKDFDIARLKAAQEFGTTDDGMNFKFDDLENRKKFSDAMTTLLAQEIELDLMATSLAELGEVQLEAAILADLHQLITE